MRHLIPNKRHEWGNVGSQVILKCLQRRQSGALEGVISGDVFWGLGSFSIYV